LFLNIQRSLWSVELNDHTASIWSKFAFVKSAAEWLQRDHSLGQPFNLRNLFLMHYTISMKFHWICSTYKPNATRILVSFYRLFLGENGPFNLVFMCTARTWALSYINGEYRDHVRYRLYKLRFKAEFWGSKRGFWGGLEAEFWVSGGWADHPSSRFNLRTFQSAFEVRGSVLHRVGVWTNEIYFQ
jgi:hypothetical protein